MKKLFSVPLVLFCLAAALGLLLRYQFIAPTPGVRYTYFLHTHSHIMFLGWIFNVLYLSFVDYHIPASGHSGFTKYFLALQLLVVAMMISFPIQGYGPYSIIFSTVHTLAAMGFIYIFYRRTRGQHRASLWFAKTGLFFFLISTAGPFSLGYLMTHGLGQTYWYNFSIYYYLHFQYNGFFFFGALSLFYQLLERKGIRFDPARALAVGRMLAVACVLVYLLSMLFINPGIVFNIIAATGALLQIAAIAIWLRQLRPLSGAIRSAFSPTGYKLMMLVLLALCVKLLLQLVSAMPQIAQLAYALRPVVIAYLHLVVIGVITLFLFVWFLEMGMVSTNLSKISVVLLLPGFIGSELCLIMTPWWGRLTNNVVSSATAVFGFSVFLVAGVFIFAWAFFAKADKSQPSW
jgi:hypothetical protein